MIGFNLSHLKKSFGSSQILSGLDLSVSAGSFVSIVGPSGCGKSTLLRIIAGLDPDFSGGLEFSRSQARKSFVFQEANLLHWRNTYENIHLPFELDPGLQKDPQVQKKIQHSLQQVGLHQAKDKFPHELSGGMKMRASIARALVSEPDLLLMDEPFSSLDEITRFDLQSQLRKIWLQRKITLLFVTHTLSEAVFLSNRVLILKKGRITTDFAVNLPEQREDTLRLQAPYLEQVQKLTQIFREGHA